MKRTFSTALVLLLVISPVFVTAQVGNSNTTWGGNTNTTSGGNTNTTSGGNTITSGQLKSPLSYKSIQEFLEGLLNFIITISVPFLALMIIYTGFIFVKARGNSEELSRARRMFYYLIIGALLILGASVLARAIKGTVENINSGSVAPPQLNTNATNPRYGEQQGGI